MADREYDYDEGPQVETIEPEVIDTSTLAVITKSEIAAQVETALAHRRSITNILRESKQLACLNEHVAADCQYLLKRGAKKIDGPTVRFAEILAYSWGNCRVAARVVREEDEFIVAMGGFHDLEKNTAIQYEVRRRITNADGQRYNTDMIGVTGNAACAIALRNAVLKGIPKALWVQVYDEVTKTIKGDIKTLAARRTLALEEFAKLGVSKEAICDKLGVDGPDDIGLDELLDLRRILTAIKDGADPAEEFQVSHKPAQQNGPRVPKLLEPVYELGRKHQMKDHEIMTFCGGQQAQGKNPAQILEALKEILARPTEKPAEAKVETPEPVKVEEVKPEETVEEKPKGGRKKSLFA